MKDEIKEIIRLNCEEEIDVKYFAKDNSLVDTTMDYSQLLDYITNLQEELKSANESISWWSNRFKAVERDNERLKVKLNCKEYFSSTMPENTEFVILTKENYDRQQKLEEVE